ncbi:isoprenylcysteine carboxylmethyltransferase family protein [Candidatus Woesearchaeota archaeon]|nr:isoprenylcysteine carboxylmethyltransferase family protein [Candidatus Woesearchaeota archaeon]
MKKKILPPTHFIILLALAVIFHIIFPLGAIYFPYNLAGFILILLGVVLNLWTDWMFKKSKTTVKPYEKPKFFHAKGPFRISRHPMYLGMLSILLGVSVVLGSIIPFLFSAVFVIIIERKFIPVEENNMEETFGYRYQAYKKKVRRWI